MKLSQTFQSHPRAGARPEPDAARAFRMLVRFAVLGAFVFGALPAAPESFAQARRASTDVSGGGKAPAGGGGKPEKPSAERGKVTKVSAAPFRAFLARARRLADEGKLDLAKRQAISVEGERLGDGTLANPLITGESASDPHFRRTAQEFVSALNESRFLQTLDGVSRVRMTFTLDGERFSARTASDTPSEARAEEMARGYRVMLNVARLMRRGTGDAAVIGGMKISASGKQLLMTLDTTREAMGNLLLRQITPN